MVKFCKRLLALMCAAGLSLTVLPFSALAAGGDRTVERLPKAPAIDGVMTAGEWGLPTMELQNYQTATVPGEGTKVPLSGDVTIAYDATHFYLAVTATYDTHDNSYTDYDLWRGDALQIQLSADGSNRRSFCFGIDNDGVVRGYQSGSHRETYAPALGGEFFVTRNEQSHTTVYELALPLSRFSDTVTSLHEGGNLNFSFAMHMHNGYYYEWCGGIVMEKNIDKAATLTLGGEKDLTATAPTPTKPELLARTGDVDGTDTVTTTDARLTLQYTANKISGDALKLIAADVDGDSHVNTTDARLILQFTAEKLTAFSRGEWIYSPGSDAVGKTTSSNTFAPTDTAAGATFTALSDLKPAAGLFGYFALTTEANEALPFNVNAAVSDTLITAMLPAGVDVTALIPTFTCPGSTVTANGAPLTSDVTVLDMSRDVTLTVTGADKAAHTVTLRVETLDTGLPSVAMTTENYTEVTSKEEYLNATFYLGGGDETTSRLLAATVKGRGNSSWKEPKKGYTVKLNEKAQLLDMSESKDWALIANYEDNTLLRNVMAEYLAEGAGLDYVVQNRPVDLWYNGQYWGTYNLVEKVEIEKDRVNITKYEAGCESGATGFLTEFDAHVAEITSEQRNNWQRPLGNSADLYYDPATDEVFMPISIGGKWLTIKKPSYENLINDTKQLRYLYDYVNNAVSALKSGDYNRMTDFIDVTSFVKWYLVEEFMNNGDSSFHSSCYMTLDVGGKLKLGPVWDFDRSSANCDYWNPEESVDSLYNAGSAWFRQLFACAEAREILKTEYASFRETLSTLPAYLEQQADAIYASQMYNFRRWDTLETVVDDGIAHDVNAITIGQQNSQTFEAEIDLLEDYFDRRTAQMDGFIPNL